MAKMSEQMKAELKAEKEYNKKHKRMYKLSVGDVVFNVINYTVFALFTLVCFFPFYFIFINTISNADAVVAKAITFWPVIRSGGINQFGVTFTSYLKVLQLDDIGTSFLVTISRTVIGTALMVVASGIVGYLVTKQEMWHRKLWYRLLVATMYFNAGIIPWFLNMLMLGLTENYLAYIIPGIVAPYNIILVKTYIESIPAEMEESAFIDGASYYKIFTKIIWPLSKPILATITIFGAVGHWNSFQDSLILMKTSINLRTLQHRLYNYLQASSSLNNATGNISQSEAQNMMQSVQEAAVLKYTIAMVTIIPILVVYPFMQRYFEEGIMLGAVKG